jgi:sulfotransferase family protein
MSPATDRQASAPAASGRRMPDFFIVGHHKSGTTALYEMLRRHPEIFMPKLKEPRFFATDLRALVPSTPQQPDTLEEYLALFDQAGAARMVGEASPSYLRSQVAAEEIARLRPDARIIAILREPASFVRSMHLQLVQEHVETEQDLALAFAHEQIERQGQVVHRYSDHIHYVEQLRRYHAAFAPEQVLVLIYDDFRADNEGTVRRVLRFLGVDDTAPIEVIDANPTVRVRSMRVDSAVRRLYAGRNPVSRAARGVAGLLPAGVRSGALQTVRRRVVYGSPPQPDRELDLALRRRYSSEVQALSEYLERDLVKLWGYEGLG